MHSHGCQGSGPEDTRVPSKLGVIQRALGWMATRGGGPQGFLGWSLHLEHLHLTWPKNGSVSGWTFKRSGLVGCLWIPWGQGLLESGWVTLGPSFLFLYVLEMRWAALLCAVPTDLKQEDQIVIDRQVQKLWAKSQPSSQFSGVTNNISFAIILNSFIFLGPGNYINPASLELPILLP